MRADSCFKAVSGALLCALLLVGLSAGAAQAEPGPTYEPMPQSSPQPPGQRAIEDWRARNPWGYGTFQMFGLTRGLSDQSLSDAGRYALYAVTVPIDLIQLPAAAIGGLWGD